MNSVTSPDPETRVVQVFTPSKFRYFVWMVGLITCSTLIMEMLDYILHGQVSPGWFGAPLALAIVIATDTFLTFQNHKIVITEDSLSGPSRRTINIVSFRFEQIDRYRTGQQNILDKINGGSRTVYSVDGRKILLSGFVYSQSQIQTILNSIGYDKVK